MPQIDYNIDVTNPLDIALKGYQQGLALQTARDQRQQQAQQRQSQQQMQSELVALSRKENVTAQDYAQLMTRRPQLADQLKKSFDILNEDQKTNTLRQVLEVDSALQSGNKEVAITLLERQKQAAINSRDKSKEAGVNTMLKNLELNPEAVKTSIGAKLAAIMGIDKFATYREKTSKTDKPSVGTFKFDEKVGIMNTTTGEVMTSVKDLGVPTVDPEKKFNQEEKLRKDFNTITKDFRTVRDSIARVKSSGKNPSAAGDLALIFNYMKILDPGSTVREGEFANAENSAGWSSRARAQYNKAISGQRLAPDQRADFLDRADRLFDQREKQYSKTSDEYTKLTERYGLNPSNVVLDLTSVSEDEPIIQEETPITQEQPIIDSTNIEQILQKYR